MKKLLSLILVICSLSGGNVYAENKWEYPDLDRYVIAQIPGEVTHGDSFKFIYFRSINEHPPYLPCNAVIPSFTFYTFIKDKKIFDLENKKILIKFNNIKPLVKVVSIEPFLLGHLVRFEMNINTFEKHFNYFKKIKKLNIELIDFKRGLDEFENFVASDYFDVKNNNWNFKDIEKAMLEARKICKK